MIDPKVPGSKSFCMEYPKSFHPSFSHAKTVSTLTGIEPVDLRIDVRRLRLHRFVLWVLKLPIGGVRLKPFFLKILVGLLGNHCDSNNDCIILHSECINTECQCSDGYRIFGSTQCILKVPPTPTNIPNKSMLLISRVYLGRG